MADDLEKAVHEFIYWVVNNDFKDPEHIFVCAEWHNLCAAVNEPMRMAGSEYRRKNPEEK